MGQRDHGLRGEVKDAEVSLACVFADEGDALAGGVMVGFERVFPSIHEWLPVAGAEVDLVNAGAVGIPDGLECNAPAVGRAGGDVVAISVQSQPAPP